jgi:hypothetical protein
MIGFHFSPVADESSDFIVAFFGPTGIMMFGQESGIGNREAKKFLNRLLGTRDWSTKYSTSTVL